MPYSNEQALIDHFTDCLNSCTTPWGEVKFAVEFFYRSGRTDVVVLSDDGALFAFEAKLTKWRDALHQAYRNTCYAHYSYIILPEKTARMASRYAAEFAQRKVGLCYISEGYVIVLHKAVRARPIQPWLSEQAASAVMGAEIHVAI
jgi:hypothetical protein